MKIEIKLADYKYCNGCPLLKINNEYFYYYCAKGFVIPLFSDKKFKHIRPKKMY